MGIAILEIIIPSLNLSHLTYDELVQQNSLLQKEIESFKNENKALKQELKDLKDKQCQ